MNRFQAHVTDEWETDTMVIQVRQLATNDTTQAVAYLAEDRDGMATVMWHQIDYRQDGREHLSPTPGLRVRHDVAVAMARAILTDAGKDADEVERLKAALEEAEDRAEALNRDAERQHAKAARLEREVEMLELLVEAKDAHLEREARTATVFVRGLEMHQGTAEVEAERANHPAQTLSEHVRRAMGRMD